MEVIRKTYRIHYFYEWDIFCIIENEQTILAYQSIINDIIITMEILTRNIYFPLPADGPPTGRKKMFPNSGLNWRFLRY